MTLALELRDIHKRFGDVVALEGAHLAVRPGTVHALLGENGAGKSTLMRVAFGLVAADRGTLLVNGSPRRWPDAAAALAGGIGMVHQHFSLVPAMTVAQNVSLGGRGPWHRGQAEGQVRLLGEHTGLVVDPAALVRDLPVGAQQRVEILKAVARKVQVLILDEPTAVLAPPEIDDLLAWMRTFVADGSRAIVVITHKLREATQVADEVTVLRAGRTVWQAPIAESAAPALVRAMLGDDEGVVSAPREAIAGTTRGDIVLALTGATAVGPGHRILLHPTTCEVRAGEIVGIAAVEGAGQHALLRLLAGRLSPTTGTVRVPDDVAFIPEDRQREAAVLDFSLTENLALRGLGRAARLSWPSMAQRAQALLPRFDVRAASAAEPFRTLSGGNQQKFVLGRELDPTPAALVVENPTRGLDVRAAAAVMSQLRGAAAAGVAVVVHATDLDEVLAIATRLWVVHAGHVREVARDRGEVGRAMLGVS